MIRLDVGTTAVAIPFTDANAPNGVSLAVPIDNVGVVVYGGASVTVDAGANTDGVQVPPGVVLNVPKAEMTALGGTVYVRSNKAAQAVLYELGGAAPQSVQTNGGGLNVAATNTPVASGTGDAQGVAAAVGLRLVGFSARENAGTPAAAEFILRHGTLATDPPVAFVKLAASESVREWFGPEGVACPNGVFVDRVSGTTELALQTKAVP